MRSGWSRLGIGLALAGIAGLGWILRAEREPWAPDPRAEPAPVPDGLPSPSLREGRLAEEGRRPVTSARASGIRPPSSARQESAAEAAGTLIFRGTVLRATREPAGDVDVAFFLEGKELGTLRTDSKGTFLAGLTVVLNARQRREGRLLVARIRVPGHSEFRRGFPLAAEERVLDLGTLVLQGWGRIEGRVVASVPLADPSSWSVSAFPEEFPGMLRVGTEARKLDAQGAFSLSKLTPGPTEVRLGHPVLGVVVRTTVEVQEGATAFLTLPYDGADPRTTLVVTFRFGQALGPGQVELLDAAEHWVAPGRVVGEELWFEGLVPGTYALRADFPSGPAWQSFFFKDGLRLLAVPPESPGGALRQRSREGATGDYDYDLGEE